MSFVCSCRRFRRCAWSPAVLDKVADVPLLCVRGVWSCFQLIVQLLDGVVDVPVVVHVFVSVDVTQVQFIDRVSSSS